MELNGFLLQARRDEFLLSNAFDAIKLVSCDLVAGCLSEEGQELLLRLVGLMNHLPGLVPVIDALLREVGLFPYIEAGDSFRDAVARESHRIEGIDKYFHREQFEAFQEILEGRNVLLSAPTSFGKSLIIDAVIASGRFANIAIVVPTIALMEETRRRVSRIDSSYRVLTQVGQARGPRNILVMTQERILEFPHLSPIDFFVIDEFYKLHPRPEDAERSIALNHAFYRLLKTGAQYYLLGPCIDGVHDAIGPRLKHSFIRTDFSTVVTEIHERFVAKQDEIPGALVKIWSELRLEPTLIYAKSPNRVEEFAEAILEVRDQGEFVADGVIMSASRFLRENYHRDWIVAQALDAGIGLHHGKIPRSIAQFMVSAFNEGLLKTLICTSTLIEGVNTTAKNVVIADRILGRKKYDYFTFNNIRGRGGRMFKHFVGRVFLLNPPPKMELPSIDIPIVSQPADLDPSLIIALEPEDRSSATEERFATLERGSYGILPLSLIKQNAGVSPRRQVDLARFLMSFTSSELQMKCSWTNIPNGQQLGFVCELIFDYFVERSSVVRSAKELARRIRRLSILQDPTAYIAEESRGSETTESLRNALDFLRNWANFKIPRSLMVVDSIQKHVLQQKALVPGDYRFFAGAIHNWFLHPSFLALEEYGLPFQVSRKLVAGMALDNFDELLEDLGEVDLDTRLTDPFEKYVAQSFQESLS